MTNYLKNKLLWIQYTPGAAGRALLVCCTTSDAVGDWIDLPLPDPYKFTNEHFCVTDVTEHMNTEPITPYNISWYTRNVLFNRGDNLTETEAYNNLLRCPLSKKHYDENKMIANVWHKPYVPTWANNIKVITICCDNKTMPWLLQRRKEVFYEWYENEVHLLRYKSAKAPIGNHAKLYEPIENIYPYTDALSFVKEDMQKEIITIGPGLNINLSTLLYEDLESTWDSIDEYIGEPINRKWCNTLMNTWRQRWV